MAEYIYNNAKNVSFSYTLFKLNCGYYAWISYKDNIDFWFKFKSADKLSTKPGKLKIIY